MRIPILDLKPAYEELRAELDAAYHRVMASGRVLLGPELEAFETEYAQSVGVAHCIGVANGLEALQLALMARGIGPGDEVIVPSHGYIATFLAVTHTGAKPIPCEPDPATYNLDPTRIASLLTPRTKAILPIHLYGQPADVEAISAIARPRGLFVLEGQHERIYHYRLYERLITLDIDRDPDIYRIDHLGDPVRAGWLVG